MTKQEHLTKMIASIKTGEIVKEPVENHQSEIYFQPETGWMIFRWYCTSETCNHISHPQCGEERITREYAIPILEDWASRLADEDARIEADAAHLASL